MMLRYTSGDKMCGKNTWGVIILFHELKMNRKLQSGCELYAEPLVEI